MPPRLRDRMLAPEDLGEREPARVALDDARTHLPDRTRLDLPVLEESRIDEGGPLRDNEIEPPGNPGDSTCSDPVIVVEVLHDPSHEATLPRAAIFSPSTST